MSCIVYLPIEVQKRELYGKLCLANLLINNGYDVVLGRYDKVKRFALSQKNGMYIDKAFFSSYYSDACTLKDRGFLYCAWDEEGLISGEGQQYTEQRLSKETLQACDIVFCWGKKQATTIEEYMSACDAKIRIVGNPRMDLLNVLNEGFCFEGCLNQNEKYILVNTNFLFSKSGMYEREQRTLAAQVKNSNKAVKYVGPQIITTRRIKTAFVSVINRLANEYEGCIVVRPHPAEDEKEYKELFMKHSNIIVSKEGDIAFALSGAKCVIHNTCTTGLESFLAGIPTITYLPGGLYTYEDSISNKLGVKMTSEDELIDLITGLQEMSDKEINDMFFESHNYKILSEYLCYDKRITASERIVALLDEERKRNNYEYTLKKKLRYWFFDIYYHFFKYDDAFEDKYHHITSYYITVLINRLRRFKGCKGKAKVTPVASDVYYIRL